MNKRLTALAHAQLRLDVEAAFQNAGRHSPLPIDKEFFDPLEADEDELRKTVGTLAVNFDEMRSRAEARFPLRHPRSAERGRLMDWWGMKGLIGWSALWAEEGDLGSER